MTFRIDNKIVLDGTYLNDVHVNYQSGKGYVIAFQFTGIAAKQLAVITEENKGRHMPVYLDETILMEPVIEDTIPDGSGIITFGNAAKKEEIERDAILMKCGALPFPLRVVKSTRVEPPVWGKK
jgi:preprotein translocase subunit SecD